MNCKSVQIHLSAYMDRELTGEEMIQVRSHLSMCSACEEEYFQLVSLKRLLSNHAVPEPPADFADRLCAKVLASQVTQSSALQGSDAGGWRLGLRWPTVVFVGVTAISMAVTFLSIWVSRSAASMADEQASRIKASHDLSFDLQRDQVYASGSDVTGGLPVVAVPDAGR